MIKQLEIQKFLRNNEDGVRKLKQAPYNLMTNETNELVLFKYNQIDSDFKYDICKEARGIILERDTWNIVCYAFDKFFNYGEQYAAKIDWDSAKIFEKIDGSIIKVYYYSGEWRIATNSTIDASTAESKLPGFSFKDLFLDALGGSIKFFDLTMKLNPLLTYIFELTTPHNRVVVDYGNESQLTLIGIRNNLTLEELDIDDKDFINNIILYTENNLKLPKTYDKNSIEKLVELADDYNKSGFDFEGFVVVDKYFNRIKIKSPKYVRYHYIISTSSPKRFVEIFLNNETEEFETYVDEFPPWIKSDYFQLKDKFKRFYEIIETNGNSFRGMSENMTRKELALNIQRHSTPMLQGYMFRMIDNPTLSVLEILKSKEGAAKRIAELLEKFKSN